VARERATYLTHPSLSVDDTRLSSRMSRVEPLLLAALAVDGLVGQRLPLWADVATITIALLAALHVARPSSALPATRGLVCTVLALVEISQGYDMGHWLVVLAAAYPLIVAGWGGLSVAIVSSFGAVALLPMAGVSPRQAASMALLCVVLGVCTRRPREKYAADLRRIRRASGIVRDRERYATALLESQPNPTAVVSADGIVRADNLAWRALLGEHGLSGSGRGDAGWVIDALLPGAPGRHLGAAIDAVLAGEVSEHRTDVDLSDRHGRSVSYAVLVRPLAGGGVILRLTDVSAMRRNDALVHQANHDGLTGLPNRSGFGERLDAVMAERGTSTVALMFIDLDRFKEVNDTWGHGAGDELLRAAAERMRRVVRPGDLLARLAGDEFVVLCQDVASVDVAEHIADRLVEVLCQPFSVQGHTVAIGGSIGIASTHTATDASALLAQADAAMYAVKRRGRRGRSTFAASKLIDLRDVRA
jgi:diguanylate cyclase (GGDEF)-like protein